MGRAHRKTGGATARPDRRSDGEIKRIASEAQRTGLSREVIDRIDNDNVRQIVVESSSFESPEDRDARQAAASRIRADGADDGALDFYGRPRIATYYERESARDVGAGDLLMDSSRGVTAWEVVRAEEKNGQVDLDVRLVDVQSGRPLGDPFQTDRWSGPEHSPLLRLAVADHETRDERGFSRVYEGYRGQLSEGDDLRGVVDQRVERVVEDLARRSSASPESLRQQAGDLYDAQLEADAKALAASRGKDWPEDKEGQHQLRREVLERQMLLDRSRNQEAEEEIREADIAFREGIRQAADEKAIQSGTYNEAARLSPAESRFWAEIDSDEQRLAALSAWQPRSGSELREMHLRESDAEVSRRTALWSADEDAKRIYGKPLGELDPELQWTLREQYLGD